MNGTPRISIVTASFNALEGLKATVASVAEQTYPDIEHIVVDGGSTDGTVEFLKSLGKDVTWISEPDEGIGDALRKGVELASGDYVVVLQAEDHFIDREALASAAVHLEGEELVSFPVILRGEHRDQLLPAGTLGMRSFFFMPVPHQGLFAKLCLFKRIGNFDPAYRIAVDYDWLVRARRAGAVCKPVDMPLSIMPETGISTRSDWPTLAKRLSEVKRLHLRHSNLPMRLFYRGWWALYATYKRIRAA